MTDLRIALMGTRGVPARYGGFETAVEEIGQRLVKLGHEVTVYCRNPGQHDREYLGMRLVNLPAIRSKTTETLSHTAVSVGYAIARDRPDVAFVFNAANAPFVPVLHAARVPVAVHLDGLESLRGKWRGMGQRYFAWAEGASVRWADAVIADAWSIAEHVQARYGRDSVFIPYGAPIIEPGSSGLASLDLASGGYYLVVARLEPENHVREIVSAFATSSVGRPLVVVGDSPYSGEYVSSVREAARGDARIRMLGGVYDQDLLDQLYANCRAYLHGHSVGGTNPSLLRAMGAGAPVLAWDVGFNREVTDQRALYWSGETELAARLSSLDRDEADAALVQVGRAGRERAAEEYSWDRVTEDYEQLARRLAGLGRRRRP